MKKTIQSVLLTAFSLGMGYSQVENSQFGDYVAKIKWPEMEKLISQNPAFKEYLGDGDYVEFVNVYDPGFVRYLKQIVPQAILEESPLAPDLEPLVEQRLQPVLRLLAPDDLILLQSEHWIRNPDITLAHPQLEEQNRLVQQLISEGIPAETLRSKLDFIQTLLNNASSEEEKQNYVHQIQILKRAIQILNQIKN